MSWIPPLLVAVPLLTAAVIAGGDHVTPAVVQNALGISAAAAVTALAGLLAWRVEAHSFVYWFGGWRPRHGVAIGIDFNVDPLAAGMCVVIAAVVTVSLVYSATYLRRVALLYDSLMLAALGAMCGFAMSGDIFNMFVWLELAGTAGYALTGFSVKQMGPLQGAINFAIINTVAGYLFAIGLALLYGRTGALNLAQIGAALAGHRSGLVIVAMTLVFVGLLTKGAALPFHFWAADAYAVAPAPVCAMFGAVMTDIGLIGIARLYWLVFQAPFANHARTIGDLLVAIGIATALLGGLMALLQRHLKRMLAYSVICHIGIMLTGIALLGTKGLAGSAVMFVSHAALTAALFLASGILLAKHGSIDELTLHGRARGEKLLAGIWLAAALGLTGLPYVGVYLGHALIDDNAAARGWHWLQPLIWLAGALASAALLRAGGRIFFALGRKHAPLLGDNIKEEPTVEDAHRRLLYGCATVAAAVGVSISIIPGLAQRAERAANHFENRAAWVALVLHGHRQPSQPRLPYQLARTSHESLLYGGGSLLLALTLAATGLARSRRRTQHLLRPAAETLKAWHSGIVGDYITWMTVGIALYGGIWALTLR